MFERWLVIGCALLLDWLLGDPPNRWHPVAWMGTFIGRLQRLFQGQQGRTTNSAACAPKELLFGGIISLGGAGLVWAIGRLVERLLKPLPLAERVVAEAAVLKITFSLRGLVRAVQDVEGALQQGNLEQARHWLGWHLVSRETAELNESQVAAAAIESAAENLSDGVIAPLYYFSTVGLPAALAYRYLNTCDAMLGYRDAAREWLGKVPARLDDAANFLPARLTAAGILAAGEGLNFIVGRHGGGEATAVYLRDRNKTASPNAGQPMSAMAGVLGVELEKVGQYRLGQGLRRPQTNDISRALQIMLAATGVCLSLLFLLTQKRASVNGER